MWLTDVDWNATKLACQFEQKARNWRLKPHIGGTPLLEMNAMDASAVLVRLQTDECGHEWWTFDLPHKETAPPSPATSATTIEPDDELHIPCHASSEMLGSTNSSLCSSSMLQAPHTSTPAQLCYLQSAVWLCCLLVAPLLMTF